MLYQPLLLHSGGGIPSFAQTQAHGPCATLAIGLGGTGVACLRKMKQEVYARITPDAVIASTPVYNHIKFLAVDSDRHVLDSENTQTSLDPSTEFLSTSCGCIPPSEILRLRPEVQWLSAVHAPEFCEPTPCRAIGRLLFILKSQEFFNRVRRLIAEVRTGLPDDFDLNIHIFTGLGGGTGSGIFLDVCYLARLAIHEMGIDPQRNHIVGYCFLPDVNLRFASIAASSETCKSIIRANAFAAMKELDYCMNFSSNQGVWDQEYHGLHVGPTQLPPVDICNLVSAGTVDGAVLYDPFHDTMSVVAEWVMVSIYENLTIAAAMPPAPINANYKYCALGASSAVVPMREIATYLASKLFEGMAKVCEQAPSNAEIKKFAADHGLTFEGLFGSMMDKTSYQMPTLQLDHTLYSEMPEDDLALPDEIHLPETILRPYHQVEQQVLGRIEANKQALLHVWRRENINEEKGSVSKMCQVYYALSDIVCSGAKGPMYAAAMLKGSGRTNIVDSLKGVLMETQDIIARDRDTIRLRLTAVKNVRTAFLHPKPLRRRSKLFEEFLTAVQLYMSLDCKIKALEEMKSMIRTMIDQMDSLYETHFMTYAKVIQNLVVTFHENDLYLDNRRRAVTDPCAMPLLTIDDLKAPLDKTVASMDFEKESAEFHAFLFANHDVWLENNAQRICRAVSSYLTERFHGYTSKTLTDYLEILFGTNVPAILADKTYRSIMMPLHAKAAPLFSKTASYPITEAVPLSYCWAPENAAVVQTAVEQLKAIHPELHLVFNQVTDRISILRYVYGLPLSAYGSLMCCYEAYQQNIFRGGLHIYEKTPDWRNLPNPIPASMEG